MPKNASLFPVRPGRSAVAAAATATVVAAVAVDLPGLTGKSETTRFSNCCSFRNKRA